MSEEKLTIEWKPVGVKMETDRQQFALSMHMWRARHQLTQREAAVKCGVSRETWIRLEHAKPLSWQIVYKVFAAISSES